MRGLDFEPSGDYLVVLLSGGSTYDSPSLFKCLAGRSGRSWSVSLRGRAGESLGPSRCPRKFSVPGLQEVWSAPIRDPQVGLERHGEGSRSGDEWEDQKGTVWAGMRWTPDAAQSLAVSSNRYIQHSAGECRQEYESESVLVHTSCMCSGRGGALDIKAAKCKVPEVRCSLFVLHIDLPLGGMTLVVDASGQQRSYSGDAWTSHSCKQMAAYSAAHSAIRSAPQGYGSAGEPKPG